MVLHWHGGDHTALKLRVKLNASGRSYNPVTDDLIALVRELAKIIGVCNMTALRMLRRGDIKGRQYQSLLDWFTFVVVF